LNLFANVSFLLSV